jgi:hypothetical protein
MRQRNFVRAFAGAAAWPSAAKLKREGLVSTKGPHRIVLQHPQVLREIARMEAVCNPGGSMSERRSAFDVAA